MKKIERKPISTYCKQKVSGWTQLPEVAKIVCYDGQEFLQCFIRNDGLNLIASVKEIPAPVIHVTIDFITQMRPDLKYDQIADCIEESAEQAIKDFFGDREFIMQPPDPRKPRAKQYFSYIRE